MKSSQKSETASDGPVHLPWEPEQAVMVVDRGGAVLEADAGAHRLLGPLGLTKDMRATSRVRALVRELWRCYDGTQARLVRPMRADAFRGLVIRVMFRRASSGTVLATLFVNQTASGRVLAGLAGDFGLTRRETDVVREILRGHDTKTVAAALNMSPYTVQDHLKSVFAKCQVSSRIEVAALAFARVEGEE